MSRDPNRQFDKTQLKSEHHGKLVHRDYAAHFFRWAYARTLVHPGISVLDIGCGQEMPFPRTMIMPTGGQPDIYVGVDYNPIPNKFTPSWAICYDNFDFTSRHEELRRHGPYNLVTCFEVIEHMRVEDGKKLLQNARDLMDTSSNIEARFLLSTPVFNGKAAANHIHEYTLIELWDQIEECGLQIVERRGTFASYPEIKKAIAAAERPDHQTVLDEIKHYYGNEVASTFLAPMYPDASRNNLWILKRK